jgi:hypothetical protein
MTSAMRYAALRDYSRYVQTAVSFILEWKGTDQLLIFAGNVNLLVEN